MDYGDLLEDNKTFDAVVHRVQAIVNRDTYN